MQIQSIAGTQKLRIRSGVETGGGRGLTLNSISDGSGIIMDDGLRGDARIDPLSRGIF
jgi:hypothetical protein